MTTTTASLVGGYEEFAPFYDRFTSGSDYESWTRHVLALLSAYGWSGTAVLDVACGTGKSFLPFKNRGFEVTGCDGSRAMLSEAARKAPDVELVAADMRALPRLGEFDLVTCFDDSLNHLLDDDALASALESMAANVSSDGLVLFDLNTLLAYRTTFAGQSVSVQGETIFVWRGDCASDAPPGCRATAHIDVFCARRDRLYERVSTRHEQRHFLPHVVTRLLAAAGLECLGVHGVCDDGSHTNEPDESRQLKAMYVARLAKGGDFPE